MMKEYKTIGMYLTPLSSEVSQMRIEERCNEMAEEGWNLIETRIIDDCNVMLMFSRDKI